MPKPRTHGFGMTPPSQMSTSSQAPGDSGDPDQAADGGDADAHAHIARRITAVASRMATTLVECSPFINFTASAADISTCSNCGPGRRGHARDRRPSGRP